MGGGDPTVKETPEQKASAKVAVQRWNDYQTMFRPYEDKYFKRVEQLNSDASMNQVSGLTDRAASSSFSKAITGTAQQMGYKRINPNSGLFQKEINKLEQSKAKTRAGSMNRAQVSQQDRFVSGLQSIAQMGQGQAVQSIAGLSSVAGNANAYARQSANESASRIVGNNQIIGAGIGGGLRYSLDQSNQQGSSYKYPSNGYSDKGIIMDYGSAIT